MNRKKRKDRHLAENTEDAFPRKPHIGKGRSDRLVRCKGCKERFPLSELEQGLCPECEELD